MPFGSERSHFTHSPHLRSALIPLIPPEIQARMGKESEVQKATEPGFVYISFPGDPPRQSQGFWPFHRATGIQSSCHMEMVKQRLRGALHCNPPRLEPGKEGAGRGGREEGLQLTPEAVGMQPGRTGGGSLAEATMLWASRDTTQQLPLCLRVPYGWAFTCEVNHALWVMQAPDIPLAGCYVRNTKASLLRKGTQLCQVLRAVD